MDEELLSRIREIGGWTAFIGQTLIFLKFIRKGNLVTKSTVDDMRHDFEKRIADLFTISEARIGEAIRREEYSRGTANIMLNANTELVRQNGKLTDELAETMGKTVQAISRDGSSNGSL